MSRLALIASLVFGISSASLVSTADAQFAKAPPPSTVAVSAADVWEPAYRVAPKKQLSRAAVRAALVKARATNLAAFRAYQAKGDLPKAVVGEERRRHREQGRLHQTATTLPGDATLPGGRGVRIGVVEIREHDPALSQAGLELADDVGERCRSSSAHRDGVVIALVRHAAFRTRRRGAESCHRGRHVLGRGEKERSLRRADASPKGFP